MSAESRKLWAREDVRSHLRSAIGDLRSARRAAASMPKEYVDAIDREAEHLTRLYDRVEAWPVTQTERDRARMKRAADKATRQ